MDSPIKGLRDFNDQSLLTTALTTPSFRMTTPDARDNQRLEFLGDAVLGMLAAERLYGEFDEDSEGRLSVRRTHMVSTAALCKAAKRLGLSSILRRNRGAAKLPDNSKTYADAIEALVGAAYLDGGLPAAREVFELLALEDNAKEGEWSENPKGELQVIAQAMKPPRHPEYELLKISGRAHEPSFVVKVKVAGIGEATGCSRTRKDAESVAAAHLLQQLKK